MATLNIEDWSTDANEALSLTLISPTSGEPTTSEFAPLFTYSLYGETQAIYGYTDLKVRILLAADDMSPCVDVSWARKVEPMGEVEAEDVVKPLRECMTECELPWQSGGKEGGEANWVWKAAFERSPEEFITDIKAAHRSKAFTPPGTLHSTYSSSGRTYEIWRSSVDGADCQRVLENMQFLVQLYIEGGQAIDLDDEEWSNKRWEVFFLYHRNEKENTYLFVGYCTLYRYYYFHSLVSGQARVRLSQFIILPPYQREGHGSRFYDAIVRYYLNSSEVREITVEDPSEEFGDLRDLQDMIRLNRDKDFQSVKLVDVATKKFPVKEVRERAKMPERQFLRCLEMQLLQGLNRKDKKAHKMFRLLVKGRIYRQQVDVLAQLARLDRIDKLDETFHHVEDDYLRLLENLKKKPLDEEDDAKGKRVGPPSPIERPSKRARVVAIRGGHDGEEEP